MGQTPDGDDAQAPVPEPKDGARPAPRAAARETSSATTYRATRRPGLTTPGVAVLSMGVGLVFGLLAVVVTGGLTLLFSVPFVLVSGYCAWEVRTSDRRAAVVAPPLTLFAVAWLATAVDDGVVAPLRLVSGVITVLAAMAPTLVAAVTVSVIVLVVRAFRER